jgi:hypothetical protein
MPEPPNPSNMRVITDATNRILRSISEREQSRPKPTQPLQRLYHYTDVVGLNGIIETNELWATSAYFLNDSAEVIYGYGALDEALKDWIAVNPRPEESLALALALDLQRGFGVDLLNKRLIEPIYLVCFCEDDNLLSQWRAYGQSGGYSIALDFPVLPAWPAGRGIKPEPSI